MVKNLLNISDISGTELRAIISSNHFEVNLNNLNIAILFEKPSTRTRLSFHVALSALGATPIELKFEDLNYSRDESFEDTFRAINCYVDGLVYRTVSHSNLINAKIFFDKPIINALSDVSHPCQIISDLFTLNEKFNSLEINILWMGDINNVCFSLLESAKLLDELNIFICSPSEIVNKKHWLKDFIKYKNINLIENTKDIDISKVHCVMTDVFISMNDTETSDKIEMLKPYSVTTKLMNQTPSESVFMHCLPAKVGFEVSEEVFRGSKSIVWRQAYNRMIAQKKLLQFIYR